MPLLPLESTMQDFPLTIGMILKHGRRVYAGSEVVTWMGNGGRRSTFARVADRVRALTAGLRGLGIEPGDRVGTLMWNNQEHLEAYLAVPTMGAVLHTLNLRLFPEQLAFVVNHAEDRVIIVDDSLAPVLARVMPELKTVEHVIVVGTDEVSGLGRTRAYAELLAGAQSDAEWPELDERAAAAMCYTTGTTGDPKGVVYSHRSIVLHTFGLLSGPAVPLNERDKILPIVPMFHAMAWGFPYAAWFSGADFLMPGPFLQPEPLAAMIEAERPTWACAVPTILGDLLRHCEHARADLSNMRHVVCGGSAVPPSLIERFEERHGVRIIQGWGMTETNPVGALAWPPRGADAAEQLSWRAKTGRVIGGVQMRIVDDEGTELPWDGRSVGEIEVRGPWVTGSYYKDPAAEKFHDGWLQTGDVGTIEPHGFLQITDRAKDVIKSGGEWISSVELENAIMAHEDVLEAAVIGVPDERWQERPLAFVVLRPGATAGPGELCAFLAEKVVTWWLPERWTFISEIPKTSVGKFDKKALRARFAEGALDVVAAPAETPWAADEPVPDPASRR